jgi:hypothetical protein
MESKVHYVRKGSPSVKTVIPQGVADALKIKHDDAIDWELASEGDRIIAKVRRRQPRSSMS